MNASPLVLSPSGHLDISPSTSASASAAKSADSARGESTFAGALKNAGPKPSRKAAQPKAAEGDPTGSGLPVTGKHSPPPAPHAGIHAVMAQQTGQATAAHTTAVGDEGPDAESGAVSGPAAGAAATSGTVTVSGGAAGSADTGVAAAQAAAQAGAQSAATGAAAGKLNGAFNNLLGLPATAGSTPIGGTAVSAGDVSAAAAVATDRSGAGPAAGKAFGMAGASIAPTGRASLKAPAPAMRSGIGSGGAAPAAVDGGAVGAGSANDPGAIGGPDGLAGAPPGSAATSPAADDASTLAATGTQAGDPAAAAAATANDAVATGLGVVSTAATTPSTTVALAAARAAATAASAQGAPALAGGNDDGKHAHGTADPAAPGSAGGDALAGLFQLNPATTASTPEATATPTLQLHPGLDSGELAQGLSDRVTYLVDNGLNGAKLQVNPPQLGPIELRIAVSGGHAQVWMTTHSAVTRDALESSSPKLREMLGAQGFGQVSVDISQRSFQERTTQAQPYQRMAADRLGTAAAAVTPATPRAAQGVLDAYA